MGRKWYFVEREAALGERYKKRKRGGEMARKRGREMARKRGGEKESKMHKSITGCDLRGSAIKRRLFIPLLQFLDGILIIDLREGHQLQWSLEKRDIRFLIIIQNKNIIYLSSSWFKSFWLKK